jgi:hypothetical protein
VFDEERLRELGHAERLRLIRALVAMESLDSGSDQAHRRRQAVGLAAIIICCVILAAWIGVLAVTLPRYYTAGGWQGAWVGFDLAELTAFATTAWAAWRIGEYLRGEQAAGRMSAAAPVDAAATALVGACIHYALSSFYDRGHGEDRDKAFAALADSVVTAILHGICPD